MEFFHTEASALRAPALSAEKEEKPLVPNEAIAAFRALQDRIIEDFFAEFAVNAHEITSALHAIPHAFGPTYQLSAARVNEIRGVIQLLLPEFYHHSLEAFR